MAADRRRRIRPKRRLRGRRPIRTVVQSPVVPVRHHRGTPRRSSGSMDQSTAGPRIELLRRLLLPSTRLAYLLASIERPFPAGARGQASARNARVGPPVEVRPEKPSRNPVAGASQASRSVARRARPLRRRTCEPLIKTGKIESDVSKVSAILLFLRLRL